MSEPFLILHKVRGEPAFDIAEKIECPICGGIGCAQPGVNDYEGPSCDECNAQGHWWIIPTSGHRAYPYWQHELNHIGEVIFFEDGAWAAIKHFVPEMPPDWPDHYACNDKSHKEIARQGLFSVNGLLEKLGFVKPTKVERRF